MTLEELKKQAQGLDIDPNNVAMPSTDFYNNINARNNAPKPPTIKASSTQVNPISEFERLKDAQLKASMAGLDKQRSGALSNLSAEKETIAPLAYNNRNTANVGYNTARQDFNAFLANKGIQNSGAAAAGEITNRGTLQTNIGNINNQETAAFSDIARRTTDVNNNYLADVEGARAGVESQYLQNTINQMNSDRNFNRGVLESDRSFGLQEGQFNMQRESADLERTIKQAELAMMQDPNSATNQMNTLKLQQMKFELQQAQELSKYAPQEAQLKIQQIKAQINASNRSNQPRAIDPLDREYRQAQIDKMKADAEAARGGKPPTEKEKNNQEEAKLYQVIDGLYTDQDKINWIKGKKSNIIGTFGSGYYNSLVEQYEVD